MLAALERSGKAENTLILYLGDHGPDFLRGKRTCYEAGVRVPMIAQWAGRWKPGQVCEELVSTIDLAPSFLSAAQAPPLERTAGQSLLPLLDGGEPEWRRFLFTEFHTHAAKPNFYPQRAVRDARYKLIENLMPGVENPGYDFTNKEFDSVPAAVEAAPPEVREAYRRMKTPPRYELYDLRTDPYEFRDLSESPEHAAALAELAKALDEWRHDSQDPLLDAEALDRLREEVCQFSKKKDAKAHKWAYPEYFFRS
ncbi:MAG: Sulfatase [candidate division BRC1 bacterium ADurb.BinA364]|nr:MAG: Sulfatase [candidate division BRC1 bacterium ADurb.BinA364]